VVFTIDVVDTGHGIGLTPHVASAVPEVVRMVAAEIITSTLTMESGQGLPQHHRQRIV
jgi:hypothetical protein